MATPLQVLYSLNIGGNFNAQITKAKQDLLTLGTTAGKIAKDLNNNQLISTFESTASILTQMGGSIAQVGIIATTAARPVAVLYQLFGAGTVAALGLTAAAALLAASLVKAASGTKDWLDEMVKVRKELVEQGYLSNNAALNLLEFEKASTRLDVALQKLKVSIADDLAPAFTDFVDAATGFLRLLKDVEEQGLSTRAALVGMSTALLGPAALTIAGLENEGARNDPRMLTGDPRSLLSPLSRAKPGFNLVGGSSYDARALLAPLTPFGAKPDLIGEMTKRMEEARQEAEKWQLLLATFFTMRPPSDIFSTGVGSALGMGTIGMGGAIGAGVLSSLNPGMAALAEPSSDFATAIGEALGISTASAIGSAFAAGSPTVNAIAEGVANGVQAAGPQISQALAGLQTGLAGIKTGSVSGVIGMAGGIADPVTAAIMEIIGLLKDPSALMSIFDEVFDLYMNLDEWVRAFADTLIPGMIRAIPEMMAAFTLLGPAVASALVGAAPQLFAAVIEAILSTPLVFARHVAGFLSQLADDLNPFNEGINVSSPFGRGGALATHFGKGKDSFLGIGLGLPTFHEGGIMPWDGLAMLRRGEQVLTSDQQLVRNNNTSVGAVNIHLHGVQDTRRLAEELQNMQGPYGYNLSLTPRVS